MSVTFPPLSISARNTLVQDAVVCGHDRDFIALLLFVNPTLRQELGDDEVRRRLAAALASRNRGAGSAAFSSPALRETTSTLGKYRAPRSKEWTEMSLDRAMDMVAERVWESRKRTFVRQVDGSTVNHTTAICHLGGATLDNEENYLIKKLFTGGLGMVCVSNQARI